MPTSAAYGSWRSPITPDLLVANLVGLANPCVRDDDAFWLEARPSEGGRQVIGSSTRTEAPVAPVTASQHVGRVPSWVKDALGVLWVVAAAGALLGPALAHGASLGPFDWLSQYGLSSRPGVTCRLVAKRAVPGACESSANRVRSRPILD